MIQFTDQSVYRIEPFLDADFLELSRGKVYPGLYFNCIVKQRDNFRSVKLSAWPDIIGENFAAVLYWTDPVLPLTPTGPAQ